MDAAGRYLYLVGRLGLRKVEHQAAVVLAPVFFPATRPTPRARVFPSWLFRRGVGNGTVAATRALRVLVARGVLEREAPHLYALQPAGRWAWEDPEQYQQILVELALMTDPLAWRSGEIVDLLRPLVAERVEATAHPFDLEFARWVAVAQDLENEYGTTLLADAIRAAIDDPSSIDPFDPENFRFLFYPLVQRTRRASARR